MAIFANKFNLLFTGQLYRKGDVDFTGKLSVTAFFDLFDCVPESGAVGILRRCAGWEEDFCMDYAAFSSVVVGQTVPVVCQFLSASVGYCGDGTSSAGSSYDLDAAMVDCGYHLLSIGVWDSPIVTYVTSFVRYHFMVYKCALRELVTSCTIKGDGFLLSS